MVRLTQSIRFCTAADSTRIAYATTGQGPAIVRAAHFLTHLDFDLNSPVWGPWIGELSHANTLVRYDGRGCGLSDMTIQALSIEAWVSDLDAVVDAAGVERFALLGCSQGAAISLAYAARNPDRVSCLILLGGYARGTQRRNATPEQLKQARLMLDLVELGWGQDNPAFRQVFTSLFIPGGSAEQVRWFNELERLSCPPEHALRTISAFGQIDVCELATRIQCPTLVMHARSDARVPFEEGRHLASLIPNARFVPLDSQNHVLLQGEPAFDRCLTEIRDFLQAQQPKREPQEVFPNLTTGERALLELLAHGLDNLQISAHLGLSEKTVRNKVSSVFSKLEASTRAQVIVRARDAGFGQSDLPH